MERPDASSSGNHGFTAKAPRQRQCCGCIKFRVRSFEILVNKLRSSNNSAFYQTAKTCLRSPSSFLLLYTAIRPHRTRIPLPKMGKKKRSKAKKPSERAAASAQDEATSASSNNTTVTLPLLDVDSPSLKHCTLADIQQHNHLVVQQNRLQDEPQDNKQPHVKGTPGLNKDVEAVIAAVRQLKAARSRGEALDLETVASGDTSATHLKSRDSGTEPTRSEGRRSRFSESLPATSSDLVNSQQREMIQDIIEGRSGREAYIMIVFEIRFAAEVDAKAYNYRTEPYDIFERQFKTVGPIPDEFQDALDQSKAQLLAADSVREANKKKVASLWKIDMIKLLASESLNPDKKAIVPDKKTTVPDKKAIARNAPLSTDWRVYFDKDNFYAAIFAQETDRLRRDEFCEKLRAYVLKAANAQKLSEQINPDGEYAGPLLRWTELEALEQLNAMMGAWLIAEARGWTDLVEDIDKAFDATAATKNVDQGHGLCARWDRRAQD